MKSTILKTILAVTAFYSIVVSAFAQGVQYTPFNVTPTILNPAFAGQFDGSIRAGVFARNQWSSITVPFVSFGAAVDLPVYTINEGGYIAVGGQFVKGFAGDGYHPLILALLSASAHKSFRVNSRDSDRLDLGFALQTGYAQCFYDLSEGFFYREIQPSTWLFSIPRD